MEDYRNLTDEVIEGDHSADSTLAVELDLDPNAEPDSELDEKSDSESTLGDHVDMYGCQDLDPSAEFYIPTIAIHQKNSPLLAFD